MTEQFSDAVGMTAALWVAGILATFVFASWAYPLVFLVSRRRFLMIVLQAVSTGIGAFLLLYPSFNAVMQIEKLTYTLISNEIQNGGAILRVSSVIIGFFTVWKSFESFVLILPKSENSEEKFVSNLNQIAQYCVFCVAACILISVKLQNNLASDSTALIALHWLFFFFVDDWILISQYTKELHVMPIQWHIYRIYFANFAIITSCIALLVVQFGYLYATGAFVVFLLLIYFSYMKPVQ